MEGKKEKREFVALLARKSVVTDRTGRRVARAQGPSWGAGVRWFKGCASRAVGTVCLSDGAE